MTGFFTRLIAANECGPNVLQKKLLEPGSTERKAKRIYFCSSCNDAHDSKEDALMCCDPDVEEGWACAHCDTEHYSKDSAELCCTEDAEFGGADLRIPQCIVCMQAVNGREDAADKWIEAAQCCIPVKHPYMTSLDCEQMGRLLAAGHGWSEAFAAVESACAARQKAH